MLTLAFERLEISSWNCVWWSNMSATTTRSRRRKRTIRGNSLHSQNRWGNNFGAFLVIQKQFRKIPNTNFVTPTILYNQNISVMRTNKFDVNAEEVLGWEREIGELTALHRQKQRNQRQTDWSLWGKIVTLYAPFYHPVPIGRLDVRFLWRDSCFRLCVPWFAVFPDRKFDNSVSPPCFTHLVCFGRSCIFTLGRIFPAVSVWRTISNPWK